VDLEDGVKKFYNLLLFNHWFSEQVKLSLIFLLNKHILIISITLPVNSKNGRRPGHHHLIKPGIA